MLSFLNARYVPGTSKNIYFKKLLSSCRDGQNCYLSVGARLPQENFELLYGLHGLVGLIELFLLIKG